MLGVWYWMDNFEGNSTLWRESCISDGCKSIAYDLNEQRLSRFDLHMSNVNVLDARENGKDENHYGR